MQIDANVVIEKLTKRLGEAIATNVVLEAQADILLAKLEQLEEAAEGKEGETNGRQDNDNG